MKPWDQQPVFCFTSDTDWCSDAALSQLRDFYRSFRIHPTYFLTHTSELIETMKQSDAADWGIHPNFSNTDGSTEALKNEIQNKLKLVVTQACRAHRYYDSNDASYALHELGIKYDATGCTRMATHLQPLLMNSGLVRFLTFWEDGSYSEYAPDWKLSSIQEKLTTPGIKVFNIHPMNFAFNVATRDHYKQLKQSLQNSLWTQSDNNTIETFKNKNEGPQTLLNEVLNFILQKKFPIMTLKNLYELSLG